MVDKLNLTTGEMLVLYRRRFGETQKQAAERLGVPRGVYFTWEHEQYLDAFTNELPSLGDLRASEVCFILRRRAKKSQKEIAEALNCSRWWVNQMERGVVSCASLMAFWESQQ